MFTTNFFFDNDKFFFFDNDKRVPEWPKGLRLCQRGLRDCQEGLRAWGMGKQMDGWMDGQMAGISPHSTGLFPLSGPLPKKENLHLVKSKAG